MYYITLLLFTNYNDKVVHYMV